MFTRTNRKLNRVDKLLKDKPEGPKFYKHAGTGPLGRHQVEGGD